MFFCQCCTCTPPGVIKPLFQSTILIQVLLQAPNEAADSINLSQKVSLAPLEEEEDPAAREEEKNLPEWSEKVASGILTGQTQGPNPYNPNPRL